MRVWVNRFSSLLSVIAGIVLLIMMVLTFSDIVLRFVGRPIVGVYEVVAFLGALVTGFALPRASQMKAQVYVDLIIDKLGPRPRRILRIITRILVFCMFLIAAWYFILMGKKFIDTRSVTLSLRLPFYPVVFGLAISSLTQCLVSVAEIFYDQGGEK